MIKRTIKEFVIRRLKVKPIVLITGARQVGKTTLCQEFVKDYGYNYVSLDDLDEREIAINDPELFLKLHKYPLIIDEVQYAPKIFEVIVSIVNKIKFSGKDNSGTYILTGSQIYNLMEGVTESMAGRVSIIEMSPLSLREIRSSKEEPFEIDPIKCDKRAKNNHVDINDLYDLIVKGFYPELYAGENNINFYDDYVKTYIERDVSQIIHISDKLKFQEFMKILASLTGTELVKEHVAKALDVSVKIVEHWLSILVAGHIVYLLEPYYEYSVVKRVEKRRYKLYFCDTGLASHLIGLNKKTLMSSIFAGHFVETYIINEIIKSYKNNGKVVHFYYYRDLDQNEIDLVILDGQLHFIECKSRVKYSKKDISAFDKLAEITNYSVGNSAVICATDIIYTIDKEKKIYAIPLSSI